MPWQDKITQTTNLNDQNWGRNRATANARELALFYKREVESAAALTKAMEPAVVFVVAGIVGTIVVALYLPMFSLITEMGQ